MASQTNKEDDNLKLAQHSGLRRGSARGLAAGLVLALAPALALADAQQIVSTVCVACHGADGNSVAPIFPRLAGQNAKYLAQQLTDYKSGKRKNDIMSPNAAPLSPEDIQGLATYFSKQKPAPATVEDKALAEAGQKLYDDGNQDAGVPACASCHKEKGAGDSRYPRVASQHQTYIIQQLTDFKAGVRTNDKGKLMQTVAGRLSEQDMKAVAEYLAGQ